MKRIILLALILLISSCATTNVIPLAQDKLKPYQGFVSVYRSESEAPPNYTVIAAITHYDLGKFRKVTIDDVIPMLQEKARMQGANGIIIDSYRTVYSGIFSRGIDTTARAILIK